jgi:hypothetical protein
LWIVAASLLVAPAAGCGSSGHKPAANTTTTSTPSGTSPAPGAAGNAAIPPSTVVELSRHVMSAGDLPGFSERGPLTDSTKAAGWVNVSEPGTPTAQRSGHAERLERLGFAAGISEQLEASGGSRAEGVSVAERFSSPRAASAELHSQTAQLNAQGGFTFFPVPAIPGARGLATTPGTITGYNVTFAKGSYFYLVGIGFPAGASPAPTRQELVTAAQHLYKRVPG